MSPAELMPYATLRSYPEGSGSSDDLPLRYTQARWFGACAMPTTWPRELTALDSSPPASTPAGRGSTVGVPEAQSTGLAPSPTTYLPVGSPARGDTDCRPGAGGSGST